MRDDNATSVLPSCARTTSLRCSAITPAKETKIMATTAVTIITARYALSPASNSPSSYNKTKRAVF
jgi:hypothetical protein